MASTTLGVTYDPQTTATALAQKYILPAQQVLDAQTGAANATTQGLSSLKSSISSFLTSLGSLTGFGKTMFQQSATLSDTSFGSATASATAAPGTYSFFVQQIATASQVSYNNVPDTTPAAGAGKFDVLLGTSTTPAFTVDLSTADTDHNNTISVRELAAAINKETTNAGRVSAAVVTVGSVQQLVLTATNTGSANEIKLDPTLVGDPTLQASLAAANRNPIVTAKDAIVYLGDPATGTALPAQSSNTFTNVDGVKVTFTKAQASGANPLTVTVASDTGGTTKNVQDFIDAYNKLKGAIDKLVDAGDPTKGVTGGAFAHDAGVRALRDSLVKLMRPTGSASLAAFGITANKDGSLGLDSARLARQLAVDPNGLDQLIGSTSASAPGGIANSLDTWLKKWNDISNGQITQRQAQIDKAQKDLVKRQDALNNQYDSLYKSYLTQFTTLQSLQSQMTGNRDLFDALFGTSKSN